MAASDTRDRILDALQHILINQGSGAVTLEVVAAEAGVSKGGLLYHFRSKEALFGGLVQRLSEDADAELAQAERAPGGAVRFYLDTSLPGSAEEMALYWSVLAALRSAEGLGPEAAGTLQDIFGRWSRLLNERVGDPVLAETIRLVGDGLYLSALAGLPRPDPELLRAVFDRLVDQAGERADQDGAR